MMKDVVTGARKAVTAHSAIVLCFVSRLSERGQANNDVAWTYAIVRNYLIARHATNYR